MANTLRVTLARRLLEAPAKASLPQSVATKASGNLGAEYFLAWWLWDRSQPQILSLEHVRSLQDQPSLKRACFTLKVHSFLFFVATT